jgi:hypothetical protein
VRLLAYLIVVASLVAVRADASESNWSSDGWKADFAPGICSLWNTYVRSDQIPRWYANISFINVADRVQFEPADHEIPFIQHLEASGMREGELILAIMLPYPDEGFHAGLPRIDALIVAGFAAEGPTLGKDPDWIWFHLREPHSKQIMALLHEGQRLGLAATTEADETITFDYDAESAFEFRIRSAQFQSCVNAMTHNMSLQLTHESDTFFAKRKKCASFACS